MNTVDMYEDTELIKMYIEGTLSEYEDNAMYRAELRSTAFAGCSQLKKVIFPNLESIKGGTFYDCSQLSYVSIPKCSAIGPLAFTGCSNLKSAMFPLCSSINESAFCECNSLEVAYFPMCASIENNAFYSCKSLKSAYFLGSSVPHLASTYAFMSTPLSLSSYLGYFGSIYVKSSMVNAFKAANYWSKYSARIVATPVYSVRFLNTDETVLQETEAYYGLDAEYTGSTPISPVEGLDFVGWNPKPKEIKQDTDCVAKFLAKYSWEGIQYSIENGTYTTDYSIGDIIPLDLGTKGIIDMEIVAFNYDDIYDGSGKAHITFVAKDVLPEYKKMKDTSFDYYGGWENCDVRQYLEETIKPLFPSSVISSILKVKKVHDCYSSSGIIVQTTDDYVWIPSTEESYAMASVFKCKHGSSNSVGWWYRDQSAKNRFYRQELRYITSEYMYNSYYIALSFCM